MIPTFTVIEGKPIFFCSVNLNERTLNFRLDLNECSSVGNHVKNIHFSIVQKSKGLIRTYNSLVVMNTFERKEFKQVRLNVVSLTKLNKHLSAHDLEVADGVLGVEILRYMNVNFSKAVKL